nr:DUF732 domain-containing protein [Mycobacterium parmense]
MRTFGVFAALAALASTSAPPVRADMMGNAFLSALANAGLSLSEPAAATALGESVCPMLVTPGGSFDGVVARVRDSNGMPEQAAGLFTIVAIATYCPAVLASLMPHRLQG